MVEEIGFVPQAARIRYLTDFSHAQRDERGASFIAHDALVIATEWEQFRALDLERLRDRMACPVVVDLRNVYRPDEMHRHGFAYACVGRSLAPPAFTDAASLDEPLRLAKVRASAPSL